MYYILYYDPRSHDDLGYCITHWDFVIGYDAMQERVCEICNKYGIDNEDVRVFDADDELDAEADYVI